MAAIQCCVLSPASAVSWSSLARSMISQELIKLGSPSPPPHAHPAVVQHQAA
jgi:hypothetical protein